VATHGRVTITSHPDGARVAVDDQPAAQQGRAPRTLYLPAGHHALRAELAGHEPVTREIAIVAGGRTEVLVTLVPIASATVPLPEPTATPAPSPPTDVGVTRPSSDEDTGRTAALWTTLGAGAALLVTGAILTGLAAGDVDELETLQRQPVTAGTLARDAALRDRVGGQQAASWVCYGLGVASLGAALVLALTAPEAPAEPAVSIGAGLTRGGVSGQATFRF
jgi:hypothetical protein